MSKAYTVIRCRDCDKDITVTAKYYDWADKTKEKRVVRCCKCNLKVK